MATFTWKEKLTVTVGEMSRTQGIDCARQFDLLAKVYTDYNELMRESDALVVINAPVTIRSGDKVLSEGEYDIRLPDEKVISLVLPLTRDSFYALPMSLSEAWINAAVTENGWFIDTLKKVFSLTSQNNSEPKSGSEPSSAQSLTAQTTMTIGI